MEENNTTGTGAPANIAYTGTSTFPQAGNGLVDPGRGYLYITTGTSSGPYLGAIPDLRIANHNSSGMDTGSYSINVAPSREMEEIKDTVSLLKKEIEELRKKLKTTDNVLEPESRKLAHE
jgi:hypothetical protein